ncbi:MAG: C40 family peptidase [Bryobacter sp.]|nr:C40 family peptidase [Bryobacter sp. CoA8 C33]
MRPSLVTALAVLLLVFLPAAAAPVAKKKNAVRRPAALRSSRAAVPKPAPRKARAKSTRIASPLPPKPLNFATIPVSPELKACSLRSHSAASGPLCLNCVDHALSTASAFRGLRYRRGGTNPNVGFDCSGFVQHVYASSCGRELPRTAREQFEVGESIAKEDLQRGDLVFFRGRQGWHVGIYTGNNQFIHSPNRRSSIQTSSLDAPFYRKTYKGARRVGTDVTPMVAADEAAMPGN